MRVSEAKFTRRYNVAQYEHEEYSLTAVVEDDEKAAEVLSQLKADVAAAYAGETPAASETEVVEDEPAPRGKKGKSKKETSEEESESEESSEDETGDDDTEAEDSESDSDSAGDEDEEEVESNHSKKSSRKSAPETAKDSSKKGGKKFKKKPQVYQRSNETHKDLFSNVLRAVAPDWKKTTESKAKAKAVSLKLEGTDFLDEEGNVLAEFKAALKKAMGKK